MNNGTPPAPQIRPAKAGQPRPGFHHGRLKSSPGAAFRTPHPTPDRCIPVNPPVAGSTSRCWRDRCTIILGDGPPPTGEIFEPELASRGPAGRSEAHHRSLIRPGLERCCSPRTAQRQPASRRSLPSVRGARPDRHPEPRPEQPAAGKAELPVVSRLPAGPFGTIDLGLPRRHRPAGPPPGGGGGGGGVAGPTSWSPRPRAWRAGVAGRAPARQAA